ncbi:MAG: metal ABC transporter substrate-binding protein [candidate division WOR-3 bacterium]|uniref:Zinc ABC transporter substrate-binding protein n=1 Tax=candidate division WOR-3 bacterium TaxID=2052148 RepID=A0A7C2BD57_UNCW3|nr:metal ABC transporter substrate-binding protein [candidate division WOR-3 bacterium]
MRTGSIVLLSGLIILLAGSCRRQDRTEINVVTTIPVTADWVHQVGGERVKVVSLLKGQEDPHSYEPGPQAVEILARAQLVVRVGLGFDAWLDGLIANAGNPKLKALTLAEGIEPVEDKGEHHVHGVHEAGNPHIWLDPEVAKSGVMRIATLLGTIDPAHRPEYQRRAEEYCGHLDSVSAVFRGLVAELNNRRFIALHNSWPYFCRAFGLEMAAAVEPLPGQEPSARSLAELIRLMRQDSVRVIVIEPQHNPDLARVLARETGAQVVTLSQFNGVLPGTDTYLKLLDYNVRTLVSVLKVNRSEPVR